VAPMTHNIGGKVPPNGQATIQTIIIPSRSGERRLLVDVDAKEQKDLKGEKSIYIEY